MGYPKSFVGRTLIAVLSCWGGGWGWGLGWEFFFGGGAEGVFIVVVALVVLTERTREFTHL